ncbi:MAG: hypothetical protein IK097_02080, partial [Clostridia bacterium]|nr:hypothetical protein [Clostridia bacterium]
MDNKNSSKKNKLITILPYILIPIFIILGISYYADHQKKEKPEYYQIELLFEQNKVDEYRLNESNGTLVYHLRGEDAKEYHTYTVPSVETFKDDVHE